MKQFGQFFKEEYFMNINNECQLKSTVNGCIGEIDSINGCKECDENHYLAHKICEPCNDDCLTCNVGGLCKTCSSDKVLQNGAKVKFGDLLTKPSTKVNAQIYSNT